MPTKPHSTFKAALKHHFAIGAFNTSNLEISQAIIGAAAVQSSPVIIQTSEKAIEYAGLPVIITLVTTLAESVEIPIILHLDHGKNPHLVKQCIDVGYPSVMIDASSKSLEENIAVTRDIVGYAHERGVWVEAELGAILGKEGALKLEGGTTPEAILTNPKEAKQFVSQTGIDALAVSVGTIHGAFKGQEYIRFEVLEAIRDAVPETPLVLHGASGITDNEITKALTFNVCKINVDTELRLAFDKAVREYLAKENTFVDPRDVLGAARTAVQETVENKIKLFGSAGRV